MKHSRLIFTFVLILICAQNIKAQYRNQRYVEYINRYSGLAVEQMKIYKIPASITLSQGLLESGAGQSTLSQQSNNHFGIKCPGKWTGKTVRHNDDAPNECFRAYDDPRESYEDHSKFLTSGSRYAFLFNLDITDYKGWARGLKQAGYATDPSYANRLITIIETYELYQFDKKGYRPNNNTKEVKPRFNRLAHQTYIMNDIIYVVARRGDTFEVIADEFDTSARKLIKYNDLHKEYSLAEGDIVYLHKKKKSADPKYTVHTVRENDSMHSISQRYGIRLENLYKLNVKPNDYVPQIGDLIWLR